MSRYLGLTLVRDIVDLWIHFAQFQWSPPPQQEGLRGDGGRQARPEHPLQGLKVPLPGKGDHEGGPNSAET